MSEHDPSSKFKDPVTVVIDGREVIADKGETLDRKSVV